MLVEGAHAARVDTHVRGNVVGHVQFPVKHLIDADRVGVVRDAEFRPRRDGTAPLE